MTRYSVYKNKVLEDERSSKINFSIDGRTYYVYRITDLETREHYYGSRNSLIENLDEDLKKYGSTSKRKKSIIESYDKYKLKIVRTFDNPGDKIIFEAFLHQYFDVKLHPKFWNESNQTPFGFDTTGFKFRNTKETKENKKLANKLKGNCLTPEIIAGIKETRLNDIIDGLNSYERAGLKSSKTKLAFSEDKKIEISSKRKETMGEEKLKNTQLKTMEYRKVNNMNSSITKKGNITKKENLLKILDQFNLVIYLENGEIEKYTMFDCYFGKINLPYGKINKKLKEQFGFSFKKSGVVLFEILLEYPNKNNKQYLHLNNAIIKKERK